MSILLSLILVVCRTLTLTGVENSSANLALLFEDQNAQVSLAISDTQIHPYLLEDSEIEFLVIENQEQEEKSESENLPLLFFVETAVLSVSKKDYNDWQTSFFSSKPKLEGIHLYDLFGCWKAHLA